MLMLGGPAKRAADGAPARQQQPLAAGRVAMGVRQHSLNSGMDQQNSAIAGGQQAAAARATAPVAAATPASAEDTTSADLPAAVGTKGASAATGRTTRSRARQQLSASAPAAPLTIDIIASACANNAAAAVDKALGPMRAVKTRKVAAGGALPRVAAAAAAPQLEPVGALPSRGLLSVRRQPQQQLAAVAVRSDQGIAAATPAVPRRVSFAPGPLQDTPDGHPTTEGCIAQPVRHNTTFRWGEDLTRGNVLLLESLLGAECYESVTRLKRRVGLLPIIRPARPHATNGVPSPPRSITKKCDQAALLAPKGGEAGVKLACAADVAPADDQGLFSSDGVIA